MHPSGNTFACGDRSGLLRIYDLRTMSQIRSSQVHAAEILTLSYSPFIRQTGVREGEGDKEGDVWSVDVDGEDVVLVGGEGEWSGERDRPDRSGRMLVMLASAGRDRLVHVLDATDGCGYKPVVCLDHHTSSVTQVKFTADGKRLLSCGGDHTLIFSAVNGPSISRVRSVQTPHSTISGLAVEATSKFAVTSGHDRRLNVWNLQSGRHMRAYKNDTMTAELYKTDVDPSGES